MTIKQIRERTNLSQRQFATATSIPLSTLRHWEQGCSKPPAYFLSLLEKALLFDGLLQEK